MTLFDPEPPAEPGAPEEALEPAPVALERTGRGIPSPWQGREAWHGGRHDPATCPTCAPYVDHPAFVAGQARAATGQASLGSG